MTGRHGSKELRARIFNQAWKAGRAANGASGNLSKSSTAVTQSASKAAPPKCFKIIQTTSPARNQVSKCASLCNAFPIQTPRAPM